MVEILDIKIIGSFCGRANYYCKMAKEVAEELGLNFNIERITVAEIDKERNVEVGCYAYCPGCNDVARDDDTMYTPALVVNGQVRIHSRFPQKEEIRELLSEYRF